MNTAAATASIDVSNLDEKHRKDHMRSSTDKVIQHTYFKELSPEELEKVKERIAILSIDKEEVESRKKKALEEFKVELDPINEELRPLLKKGLEKGEEVTEECYLKFDPEEDVTHILDAFGIVIETRKMKPSERQITINTKIRKL